MKTQYYTAASLDGFIATTDDSLEWLFQLGDVEETSYPEFIAEVAALAMGSATYEWILHHEEMRRAAGGKNIWLAGGGDLVGQFHDAGLLDEIIVQIASVTLGSGKPLLPRQIAFPPLRLSEVRMIGPGFAELRYDVASSARESP